MVPGSTGRFEIIVCTETTYVAVMEGGGDVDRVYYSVYSVAFTSKKHAHVAYSSGSSTSRTGIPMVKFHMPTYEYRTKYYCMYETYRLC